MGLAASPPPPCAAPMTEATVLPNLKVIPQTHVQQRVEGTLDFQMITNDFIMPLEWIHTHQP